MTRDEIIRIAQQSGLLRAGDGWTEPARWGLTEIERFAALVAAAEREACAKVAAWILKMPENDVSSGIRARGIT